MCTEGRSVPQFVFDFSQGSKDDKDLLGGKGANLAEMTNLGLPVPPGFTISTEACRHYLVAGKEPDGLADEVSQHLTVLQERMGKRLGDSEDPLLVSVRSGAKFSMPGMMETVLNVGLNDASVEGLAARAGDQRFAWDSYRRLLQMFGKTVLGIDGERFEERLERAKEAKGVESDLDLDVDDLRTLVGEFKDVVRTQSGRDFPQDPRQQMDLAVRAVFDSWNIDRARLYCRQGRIPDALGTAVNIVAMVFGNLGPDSGTGVAFTRDPATGQQGVYGDYLANAQGEDVVAGIRNTLPLADLEQLDKSSYDELLEIMSTLERHYKDLCDIEFTIERGRLWMLQTRVGKRTAAAAFRIAGQLVDEGLIDEDEALSRVTGDQLARLMFPQFDPSAERQLVAKGMAASPGAAVGKAVFSSASAVEWADSGEDVILIRRETNPDDLSGMVAAKGILTSRGGKTSHAAVVARGMGRTCVVGAEALRVDTAAREFTTLEGDEPEGLSQGDRDVVDAVKRLMTRADKRRRLGVRANADTPEDAQRARTLGAQGIGLCRTEHMFLGDRRKIVERVILAQTDDQRDRALSELLPPQREDFIEILEAMDGLPVTIRLLDPPLHEFLPDFTELSVQVAVAEATGEPDKEATALLAEVQRLHEQNPMLGLRGVRLGLVVPGLFSLQVRAIAEAAASLRKRGLDPQPEIMVPLVAAVQELEAIRDMAATTVAEVAEEAGVELSFPTGTMIEFPRACM